MAFEWYTFKDTAFGLSADLPENTHLVIELTSKNLIYIEGTNQIKAYHFNVTTGVETELDIDPSDSSGDNKSRDQKIQSLWHDRDNQIIWGGDCDNPENDFDVWKLDYSGSETSPSVTEIGTGGTGDAGTIYLYDIFIVGSNTYVMTFETRLGNDFNIIWDVDTAPFTKRVELLI